MIASVFFDTNILVYAAVGTGKDERKQKRALELIQSEDFATSVQVLQEFFVTVVRKASRPLSAAQALEWIEQWTAFPCQAIDHQLVRIAIEQSERYRGSHGLLGGPERWTDVRAGASLQPVLMMVLPRRSSTSISTGTDGETRLQGL